MNRYYRVDTRRLGFAELWRISPGPGFVIAAVLKLLRVPLRVGLLVPWLDGLEEVRSGDLPPDVAQAVDPLVEQWRGLGFERILDYTVDMRSPRNRAFAAALLAKDGRALAQVMFAEVTGDHGVRRKVESICLSRFEDGAWYGVSSGRRQMEAPPEFHTANLPGGSPAALYALLQRGIAGSSRGAPLACKPEEVEGLIVAINNRAVEFQAQRGVYVPAEAGEVRPAPIG